MTSTNAAGDCSRPCDPCYRSTGATSAERSGRFLLSPTIHNVIAVPARQESSEACSPRTPAAGDPAPSQPSNTGSESRAREIREAFLPHRPRSGWNALTKPRAPWRLCEGLQRVDMALRIHDPRRALERARSGRQVTREGSIWVLWVHGRSSGNRSKVLLPRQLAREVPRRTAPRGGDSSPAPRGEPQGGSATVLARLD
jgi:hypothetical protein